MFRLHIGHYKEKRLAVSGPMGYLCNKQNSKREPTTCHEIDNTIDEAWGVSG